jgi:hypothetical protein
MKNLLLFFTITCFCIACNTPTTPEIRQIRPRFVIPTGEVVITGSGFLNNTTVVIGGQNATVSGFTANELKVKAPVLTAGSYDIVVSNPNQSSATSKGLNILASTDNYFADQTLVVFKQNPDENKASSIATNAGMTLVNYKAAEVGASGICAKTLAVFEQQGGTSRAVDTASDIPDVLEANPHEIGTGGAYSDTGPTTVSQHKNEFTALELDRAYTFWKTKISTLPKPSPRVAVIDTGVTLHYEFRNLFTLADTNLLSGKNFTSEGSSSDTTDIAENSSGLKVGHGTAVAAIISARDSEPNNNFGNTFWQVGILPAENTSASGAEILPVKACDKTTKCKGIDVIKAICYAISQKSDVINLSLSTQQPSSIVKQTIQAATDAGIVVVASAGNRGTVPQYPAAYSLELPIIAVGSVRYDPSGKYKASSFSVPGAWVSLVAPGETQSASFDSSSATGFGYRSFEGTSFAAPWVSGVAAMLKALDPSLMPLEIKNKIIAGATRTNLECVPLEKCGAGLLNAAQAIGAP